MCVSRGATVCLMMVLATGAFSVSLLGQHPDPPGQTAAGEIPEVEAYLFAHMKHGDYGRLYYSVSRDGLHWEMLHGGKRVSGSISLHCWATI